MHVACAVLAAKEPGRQSEHTLALVLPGTGLAVPIGHARHAALLDAPTVGLYVPVGHCTKVCRTLAAPVDAQYPPAGQSAHAVALSSSLSFPAGQAMHPEAERAAVGLYVPGMHGKQDDSLVPTTGGGSMKVPLGHGMGCAVPCGQ